MGALVEAGGNLTVEELNDRGASSAMTTSGNSPSGNAPSSTDRDFVACRVRIGIHSSFCPDLAWMQMAGNGRAWES